MGKLTINMAKAMIYTLPGRSARSFKNPTAFNKKCTAEEDTPPTARSVCFMSAAGAGGKAQSFVTSLGLTCGKAPDKVEDANPSVNMPLNGIQENGEGALLNSGGLIGRRFTAGNTSGSVFGLSDSDIKSWTTAPADADPSNVVLTAFTHAYANVHRDFTAAESMEAKHEAISKAVDVCTKLSDIVKDVATAAGIKSAHALVMEDTSKKMAALAAALQAEQMPDEDGPAPANTQPAPSATAASKTVANKKPQATSKKVANKKPHAGKSSHKNNSKPKIGKNRDGKNK